ncbi:MAG TPA: bifunctional YncE family protein/alkaline phosphatase family protein [Candidatus Limnocylindrales bacterium]|nr:bifunctional YncE family protein/alkaline phosphatase family protein [Candidatus Limnocylindrales bacterium]
MKCSRLLNVLSLSTCLALAIVGKIVAADNSRPREALQDVNSPDVREQPGLHPGEHLLFNGWGVTPVGRQVPVSDLALKMVIAPDQKRLIAVHGGFIEHGVTIIDVATGAETQFLAVPKSWNGLAFSRDGKRFFISGGDSGEIHIFKYVASETSIEKSTKPAPDESEVFLAGIAVRPDSGRLYVCNEARHEVWVLNPDTLALEAKIDVGLNPHSCILGADRRHLYVSNWGGRSVSVVDTEKARHVREIEVGVRPNDMALAPDGRLFVACSGDNTVHVIQTRTLEQKEAGASPTERLPEGTREIISTSLYPGSPEGSTPDAVAISPDGHTLFVANADNNSVMVADISNTSSEEARRNRESVSIVEGFIPVGWYPSALAVSPDNRTLYVANGKGLTSRANVPPLTSRPLKLHKPPRFDYIPKTFAGAISIIQRPDTTQMSRYTEQVRRNSPFTPEQFHHAPIKSDSIIPDRVGESCPIKYVLYIIKENRTYDQVMGDFRDAQGRPRGNGDSNLTIYGEQVTPNHHQIAREYVLLDNLYCNGEVSVDGHSWCDAAIATDYNQRSWILSYSSHGRLPGNREMETPTAGYLWDLCRRHGISFKNYGEGALRVPSANRGRWSGQRDMERVKWWIEDLHTAEQTGVLPSFTIMSLGENHTRGTTPGAFTPDACVASNDIGLGQLVEAATRSRFWKEMAIFVIEDDAQNGPDHVDAHRTVGLVISPYCKRAYVDSTLYTTASMVRTIELILGLPPLTQYDAGATPMFNSFTKRPKLTPYQPLVPRVDLFTKNTTNSPYAKQSARMNFRDYDLAPEDELNRILWHTAKGPDAPYPTPIHRALFTTSPRPNSSSKD